MNFKPDQYEQVLAGVPDTAIILFAEDLRILQIIDGNQVLPELLPDIASIIYLTELGESTYRDKLLHICRNALERKEESLEIMGDNVQLRIRGISAKNADAALIGILFIQGKRGLLNSCKDELERQRGEAEENSEIKSRFMARVSHEIRTPLNAIIGFIEQLQKTSLNETQEKYLKIIDKSSMYLLDLVNEILTFSKIESGAQQLDLVDFNLQSLFKEIYHIFKNKAEDKGINLRYSFDQYLNIVLKGDAFRLKQIVNNLVSNAIKFTEYGFVELNVSLLKEEKESVWIRIQISDTGIGISEDKLQHIFKEYKQASAGIARKHGGTGLGLTISKRLTELMDGEISVSSVEGKGSRFCVDIPMVKSQRSVLIEDSLRIEENVLSGQSALIVDDDAMNRLLGEIILKGFGMDVSMASDGKEAIRLLDQNGFQIVLLDIHMPDITGLDLARHIRTKKRNKEIKILAVTADMIREELDDYLSQGIDDYMIKPYREIAMFNKLCRLLNIDSRKIERKRIKITLKEEPLTRLYNLHELRSVTKDNPEFFNEMLQTFIDNARSGTQELQQAYQSKDWEGIGDTAHRLIPSFKHLAIKTIVSDLIELKNISAKKEQLDRLGLLVKKIELETGKVLDQLQEEKMKQA